MTTAEKENPWERLFATVKAVLADPTHENDVTWYQQLLPIVTEFIENELHEVDSIDVAVWLLIFQQRWFQEGSPGCPHEFASPSEAFKQWYWDNSPVAAKQ
jgi:hypothetical protein